ncbi:MAG: hypothetical protein AB7F40_04300 [Victivallaceae bacterium]
MAFFPHVTPSDQFAPSAMLSNAVRDIVNELGGMSGGAVRRGSPGVVRWPVYNPGETTLAAGASVQVIDGALCDDAIPVALAVTGAEIWAILTAPLAAGEIGDAIFVGATIVSVTGTHNSYVVPNGYGGYTYSSSGLARVVFYTSSNALVVLGGTGGGSFAGFFAVAVDSAAATLAVKVVDGTGVLGTGYCGLFVSGTDTMLVPAASLAIPAVGTYFVVLTAVYTAPATSTGYGSWTVGFTLETQVPELDDDSFKALLGVVTLNASGMIGVVQLYNNGVLYNNRYA